jgi:hypothetical protein
VALAQQSIVLVKKNGPALACISPVFCLNVYGFVGRSGEKWVLHLDMLGVLECEVG